MNAFNTRLFWFYCLGGGFLLLTLYLPLSCTVLETDYTPSAEWSAHQKRVDEIDSWLRKRDLNHNRVEFYEALAGKRKLETVRSANLRDAARRLLDLPQPITLKDAENFRVGYCVHRTGRGYHADCKRKRDVFGGDLKILNDPQKVVWLMSGDPSKVAAVLPSVPDTYRHYPTFPEGVARYSSVKNVSGWTKWSVMSLVFAFGFFVLRIISSYANAEEEPFRTSTETGFSRLVLAGFAPGFLFFTGLHMLTPDGRVARFHLKRLMRLTNFADEHEALITRLQAMREKALGLKNSDKAVREIDSALERIRSVKDFEALSKLHGDAEEINNLYIGKAEVEAHLS